MKILLFSAVGVGAVFLTVFLITHQLLPAATIAACVGGVTSCIVTLRTVRDFPRPWMRRGARVLIVLFFALLVVQWGVAEFGRPASISNDVLAMRALTHGTLQSLALSAAHASELLRNFYSIPEPRRRPFGIEARAYLRRINAMDRLTAEYDRRYRNELVASPDSELVIRTRFVLPGPSGAAADSIETQGRLILTGQGARYVIDR